MTGQHTEQQILGALYVRNASSFQEDAFAMDDQRAHIEKYALKDDVRIVKTYQDIGISGRSDPKQLPGLSALLEDARQGVFNVLYIASLNRLGRRPEHLMDIVSQLQTAGVKIKVNEQGEVIVSKEMMGFFNNLKKLQV
jgi:DNA invertase Pin-like site-specific DNA recombinase